MNEQALGDLSGWNPFKEVTKVMDSVQAATTKITAALPITAKFDTFVNKTVINPQRSSDNLMMSIFNPDSTVGKILSGNVTSVIAESIKATVSALPASEQGKLSKLVAMGTTAVDKSLATADWHTDKVVAWELKNPAILKIVGAIVVACVCSYAFGAWGSIISSTGMKVMTQPPKTPPLVPGSIDAGNLQLGEVGPEVSAMFKAYADVNGIPTMLIPVDGTDGIWIPATQDGIEGGTKAALEWTSRAVVEGSVSVDNALQILNLLAMTIQDAVKVGLDQNLMNPLLTLITQQEASYRAGIAPAPVATTTSISPWLLAGLGLILALAMKKGKK